MTEPSAGPDKTKIWVEAGPMTEPEGVLARAEELLLEGAQAQHADRNLAQLRAKDTDAARVLTVGFVEALMDPALYKQQGEEHRRYYALKMESGETHLWDELFAGIDAIE